ncbi:MAG: glycosyltransferase [Candidatus Aminicenantes bacterium]|nr:glycosyltransferase [Candidatus Aminicenantes bacterium]
MNAILHAAFHAIGIIILIYFFLINGFYFLFTILSLVGIFHHRNLSTYVSFKEVFRLPLIKPISIIATAYNEEVTIIESVRSLLSLEYPNYEVIVVNDGSTDRTLDNLITIFRLQKSKRVFRKVVDHKPVKGIYASPSFPKLIVIDKVNGRKADALNAGLNVSRYPLFCAVDADSLLEKSALLKIVRPFLEDPERTIAAGGIIRLSNGCTFKDGQLSQVRMPRNFLARFQVIEYFRAFLGGRIGLSMLKSLLIISGAFGLFRKDVALQCGGYRTGTIGEDLDLIVRMRRHLHNMRKPFEVRFIPDPICWTEAPETLRSLSRQRNRWHRGLLDTIRYNRIMLFNPRYGVTGLFALPFYFVFEMLGPLIELAGYVTFLVCMILGQVNTPFALLFFLLAVVLGTLLSLLAVLIEEYSSHRYPRLRDILIIALFSLLENVIYRQWLSIVRVLAFFDFAKGKQEWGAMEKKGFARPAET